MQNGELKAIKSTVHYNSTHEAEMKNLTKSLV